jgi:glycerophosphoryl diester phosphodiesterase
MIIIGHRGARGLAPENTLLGIKKGLEHGVDEIECDLRVTKDHVVILHHNKYLRDPSGRHLRISEHTYKELVEHKPDLATFEQAIDTLNRRRPLYVEVKSDEPTGPIIKVIRHYLDDGWQPYDFRLASFSLKILTALRKALPTLPLVVNESWSGVRASHRARKLRATRISMNARWLWSGYVWATTRGGHELVAFTVNNPNKALTWQRYGLSGVVTDYPDRFQKKS